MKLNSKGKTLVSEGRLAIERTWVNHELANQYEAAIQLLELIQIDYRRARKQLQDVSLRFSEREAIASKQLHTALDALDQISVSRNSEVSISPGKVFPKQAFSQESTASRLTARQPVPNLEVYCLGKFQIRVNWKKIEYWRSAKAKSLLKSCSMLSPYRA